VTEPVRCRWILIQRRVCVVSIGEGGSSPACSSEEDGDGEGRRGSRTRRRGAEKVPAALLLHFPASVSPTEARRGGTTLVQELAGGVGYVERKRTGGREDVWEAAGAGVSSLMCSEGLFIGRKARDGDVQMVAGAGALATCKGNAGRGGFGSVLAGFGRRWRDHAGRQRAESRGEERRGPGVFFLFSSTSHGLGRGRGGWGSTERKSRAWLQGWGEREQRWP
jgi:hypothetical protein